MCLQFLWLLQSSSSLLAHALTTLGSANSVHSVNSKIVGTMSRISLLAEKEGRMKSGLQGLTSLLASQCGFTGRKHGVLAA